MTSLPNSIGSLQDIKGRHGSPPDFSDLRMATLVTAGPLAKAFGSFGSIGDQAIGSTTPSPRSGSFSSVRVAINEPKRWTLYGRRGAGETGKRG